MRLFFFVGFLCCVPALVSAQTQKYCEPPAETRALLRAASPIYQTADLDYREVHRLRRQGLNDLNAKQPGNFWIQRDWIEASKDIGDVASDGLVAQLKEKSDANSKDLEARFLYATALIGRQTPEAIRLLESVLADNPDFAIAHRTLMQIWTYPRFQNGAKEKSSRLAFLAVCPDSTMSLAGATRLKDGPEVQQYAARMRSLFDANPTSEDLLNLYPSLWSLEFNVTPVLDHPKVRERVAKDMKVLTSLKGRERELNNVLIAGYKTLGDKENEQALLAQRKASVGSGPRVMETMSQWYMKNPRPKTTDPEERQVAYNEAWLKAAKEWSAASPDEPHFLYEQAHALADLPNHPESEILAVLDEAEAVRKRGKAEVRSGTPPEMTVARIYARRGIRLDQVPALIEKANQSAMENPRLRPKTDLISDPADTVEAETLTFNTKSSGWWILFQTYMKLKQPDKARQVLMEEEKGIDDYKKRVETWKKELAALPAGHQRGIAEMMKESSGRSLPYYEQTVVEHKADLAVHENRKVDALAFYQAAIRQSDQAKSRFLTKAQGLWKDLGGTNEGWHAWEESLKATAAGVAKKPEGAWTKLDRPLPDFNVPDLAGKSWTKTNFNGKTTFVNLWATWCAPCRNELPHLEKLYQQIKNREDVQLITLNVDDSMGLVDPFMKEHKYTFPVLFAKDVVQSYLGSISIPRNWVVDRASVLRVEGIGFDGVGGDDWIKKMTDQIESVRSGK